MHINSISPTMSYSRSCKPRYQKLSNNEPQNSPAFQGWKGGAKGGALGALAAAALAVAAGPVGIALLPLWTVGGAIAGHANEEENSSDKK